RVAFSPGSKHLVAASWDRTVRVWDTATGDELHNIRAHAHAVSGLALSPDGKSVVTCSPDETLKGWEVATGQCIFTLQPPHERRISPGWTASGIGQRGRHHQILGYADVETTGGGPARCHRRRGKLGLQP